MCTRSCIQIHDGPRVIDGLLRKLCNAIGTSCTLDAIKSHIWVGVAVQMEVIIVIQTFGDLNCDVATLEELTWVG